MTPVRVFRKVAIGMVWLSLLALATVLTWLSTWLQPPKPICVMLLGASYQDNQVVPPNVYGWRGLVDLAELCRTPGLYTHWGSSFVRLAHEPVEFQTDTNWQMDLDNLREKTLVLVVALHGAADTQGAFLFPQDTHGQTDENGRVRMTKILDRLEALPKDKNKVLILDATQVSASWHLGFLHNDFARQLESLDDRIASIPNLVVINASSPDERSWPCEPRGRTIFFHYLMESLRGGADDMDHDHRTSVWEVFCHVRSSVQSWAQSNRAALQTPILLPSGKRGQSRASNIDMVVVPRDREVFNPPEKIPEFVVPEDLRRAWQTYQRLSDEVPSPWTYAPRLWRQYQDTLLRYEQVLTAGDRNGAAKMYSQLGELEIALHGALDLELGAIENSLAMIDALGAGLLTQSAGRENLLAQVRSGSLVALANLWDAPPDEYDKRWAKLKDSAGSDRVARQLLRLRLFELLFDRAAENPAENVGKACAILGVLTDSIHLRPAEIHFLRMLGRDLPSYAPLESNVEVIRSGIRVRGLAERAALGLSEGYSYSEQVYRWIRPQVESCDAKRRMGEDLLFADPENWRQAREHLKEAEKGYRDAINLAQRVSQALAVRDRTLAMLPYYSRWLSRRMPDGTSQWRRDTMPLAKVEDIWRDVHRLSDLLEQPQSERILNSLPLKGDPGLAHSLAEQTETVQRAFAEIQTSIVKRWQMLTETDSPGVFRATDEALVVPQFDPELRMKLLANKWRIARRLLTDTSSASDNIAVVGREDQAEWVKQEARANGCSALAMLGTKWYQRVRQKEDDTYEQLHHRLDVFSVEKRWWESVAIAGDEIGRAFRQMPPEIHKFTQQARQAESSETASLLCAADRLARLTGSAASLGPLGDPADGYRRLLLQGFLCWLCERSIANHWYSEDAGVEPYYRRVGTLLLSDAQGLVPHNPVPVELSRKLSQSGDLVLLGPDRVQLTTEQRLLAEFRVGPAKDAAVPAGHPVIWAEPGKDLRLELPDPGKRIARRFDGSKPTDAVPCTLSSPRLDQSEVTAPGQPRTEPTSLAVTALFRGQRIAVKKPVDLLLGADTVHYRYPLPDRGSVALRAGAELHRRFGDGSGAVAIVLDCSGSMGPLPGKTFDKTTKYAEATEALRQVLQKLPSGTTVSLWVFGQAVGTEKTVKAPEQTIQRIQAPVRWTRDNPDQLKTFMAMVEYPHIEPWNESPILRAILAAKEDLKNVTGFKTLLVLTDGMDNRFEKDHEANPRKETIPTVLQRTFQGTGIVVNIIGFKVVDAEEATARKQFDVVEKFSPPGTFCTTHESDTLAATLDKALRQQLRYWIEDYQSRIVPGVPSGGFEVSRTNANDQWFPGGLQPGNYRVRTQLDQLLEQDIVVGRGDLLLLRLGTTADGPAIQRVPYGPEQFRGKPSAEASGNRLTVIQNQRTDSSGLQMLFLLEPSSQSHEPVIQLIRPREAWVEVAPQREAPTPVAVRWHYQLGYPAPAWSVDVPQWPSVPGSINPARPTLQFWWNPDQETPLDANLDRGNDFHALADLAGHKVRVGDDLITIESVAVERHAVQTQPKIRSVQSCLVVRLAHAPNKPVWVKIDGVQPAGCEQRFYQTVGKTSVLFWPVSGDQADQLLSRVSIVSVETFKRHAKRRGFAIQMDQLPAPDPSDFRPRPLLETP